MANASQRLNKGKVPVILDDKGGKAPRSDDMAKRVKHKKG
jgi:hypothetical protein